MYKNILSDDLENCNDSDFYGVIFSLWNGLVKFEYMLLYICVFNLEIVKYGWYLSYIIVEIIVLDMLFLVDLVCMLLNCLNIIVYLFFYSLIGIKCDKVNKVEVFVELG